MASETPARDFDALRRLLLSRPPAARVRETVIALLTDIATGTRELPAVLHPLGFLCLPLVRDGARGVCVHLYGPLLDDQVPGRRPGDGPEQAADTLPHAHSWELISHVLYGRVGNLPIRVRNSAGDRATHRVFEIHSTLDGVDHVRPTSRLVRTEPAAPEYASAGQTYTLPAGQFHATVRTAPRSPAATLVLGRTLSGYRDLSLGPLHGTAYRVVRRRYDIDRTARVTGIALRRLHAAHSSPD
jgi:hypothetical protein